MTTPNTTTVSIDITDGYGKNAITRLKSRGGNPVLDMEGWSQGWGETHIDEPTVTVDVLADESGSPVTVEVVSARRWMLTMTVYRLPEGGEFGVIIFDDGAPERYTEVGLITNLNELEMVQLPWAEERFVYFEDRRDDRDTLLSKLARVLDDRPLGD